MSQKTKQTERKGGLEGSIVYLQNGIYMGDVELIGAVYIIDSARQEGHSVEVRLEEGWFDVHT